MPKLRLDLRLLRKSVAVTSPNGEALAPGGRAATGLMDAVRRNLDAIVELKTDGSSWTTIATGLSAQGFRTADGREITARNLTGIISSIRRQAKRKADRAAKRARRPDLIRESRIERTERDLTFAQIGRSRPTEKAVRRHLAPELQEERGATADETSPIGEDEIRRIQAEKHKHLLMRG